MYSVRTTDTLRKAFEGSYPKDFIGRTIQPGDTIAYAVRDRDTATLKLGTVKVTRPTGQHYPKWRITVEIDSEQWVERGDQSGYTTVKKLVTLGFPERILVIR